MVPAYTPPAEAMKFWGGSQLLHSALFLHHSVYCKSTANMHCMFTDNMHCIFTANVHRKFTAHSILTYCLSGTLLQALVFILMV